MTDSELRDYISDMFLMVWRDATAGLGAEKHVVCNSATEMVVKRIKVHDKTLKQKLLEALPEDKYMPTESVDGYKNNRFTDAHHKGFNESLSDVTKAIEQVYGDEK